MSKIERLLEELCPSGVEYESLVNLCGTITTGKLNANAMDENGVYPFFTCDSNPFKINTYAFDEEAILISGNGSKVGHINYYKGKFNAYQRTYVLYDFKEINVKFLLHFLNGYLKEYILKNCKKGSVPYITLPMLQNFSVPVPPLEVQNEIVHILDDFTLLSSELSAELKARQKQYEYYKNYLLKNYENEENICLQSIAEYSKDRIHANELNENNYIGVDNLLQNKQGKVKSEHIPKKGNSTKYYKKDILIGNIRPYLKKIWFADNDGGTNGDVLVIHIIGDKVIPEYLYYILSSDKFFDYDNSNSKGAKMPRGNKDAVMNYKFYLPSKDEQLKIVNTLERFETLCNDITCGLPAEIEARQKQYEYYRDKLLTFKELVNEG